MKKFKILSTTLCCSTLLLASAPFASAQSIDNSEDTVTSLIQSESQNSVIFAYGKKFTISPDAEGKVTQQELEDIAKQATSDEIKIENVFTPVNDNALPSQGIVQEPEVNDSQITYAWYDLWINWDVSKKVTQRDTNLAARQITSVPAGGTKKITDKFTVKSSVGVNGSVKEAGLTAAVESSLTSEISRTIETTYSGPKMGSGYNSIIYWITPYVNRGTWSATGKGNVSGDKYGPYTGTYEEPTKFIEWSQLIK